MDTFEITDILLNKLFFDDCDIPKKLYYDIYIRDESLTILRIMLWHSNYKKQKEYILKILNYNAQCLYRQLILNFL